VQIGTARRYHTGTRWGVWLWSHVVLDGVPYLTVLVDGVNKSFGLYSSLEEAAELAGKIDHERKEKICKLT
jgi:hypothetical protein